MDAIVGEIEQVPPRFSAIKVDGQRAYDLAREGEVLDLAAALNGGRALACNDEHYGRMSNILNPGRAASMADH